MTPQEQNIAIAEACGWKNLIWHEGSKQLRGDILKEAQNEHPWYLQTRVPNYPDDLNAMHEAEKVLTITLPPAPHTESEKSRYVIILRTMCGDKGCVIATAAQRAEAFLKTIGKWKE